MNSRFQDIKARFAAGALSKSDFIVQMHEQIHSVLFDYASCLGSTDVASIEICDGQVLMTSRVDSIRIAVDADDHRTAPIEILNFGSYEPEETEVIRRIAKDMNTMLDIGANIGWYSLLAKKINPNSSIHSFEPIPTTFDKLKYNCSLNDCSSINCHNYGFSAAPGSFPFYFYPEGGVNASLQNLSGRDDVFIVECQLRVLDSVLEWLEPDSEVDFIKCDVEGNELFVMQGGMALISHHKPILFLELLRKWSAKFGYHPNEVISLLEEIGYNAYVVSPGKGLLHIPQITDDTLQTNFFFVHPESRLYSLVFNP